MAHSLEEFLTEIHLEQYIPNFALHRTNILTVDDETLQSIGINLIGHRKRILTELHSLKGRLTEKDNFQPYIVNHDFMNDDDDEPPPLPPKQSRENPVDNNVALNLPSPETEDVAKPRPVKPPRPSLKNNLAHSMSLPVGVKPSTDYKFLSFKLPPVPPRSDLETSPSSITVHSPTSPPVSDVAVEKSKPVPPARPKRLSVKRSYGEPKEQQTSPPIPESLDDISPPDPSPCSKQIEDLKMNTVAESNESGLNAAGSTDDEDLYEEIEPVPLLEDEEDEDEKPKNTLTLSMVK